MCDACVAKQKENAMSEQDRVTTTWTESDRELLKLMDAMSDVDESGVVVGPSPLGVLCLVGETQCGKSSLIKHWAAEHEWRLLTVMPGVDSPEDLGGLPVRDGDRLAWTQPSVIPVELLDAEWDGKWVLYLDEIEKATPDVIACLLSVLSDRRLRNTTVRPAAVVCSMNPSRRPLHEALIARLLCVPYPPAEDYDVWDREGLGALRHYIGNIRPQIQRQLPRELRTTPGSLHRMAHWLQQRMFWESSQVRQWIIEGSFSETDAVAVQARFSELPTESTLDWGATADAAALAAGLVYYTATATPEIAHELHELLQARAQDDVTGEIGRVLTAYYKTPDATLSTEGWPTETREEYYVRLESAQQQSAKKAGFPIRSKSDVKGKSRKGDGEGTTTRSAA
jgi:hypothetical protein